LPIYFATPGVGADGRNLLVVNPVGRIERQAGRFAARVAAPVALGLAALHVAGTHDDEVAAPYFVPLCFGCCIQIGDGNGLAVLQRIDTQVASDVEQYAAADHFGLDLFDAVLVRAVAIDQAGIVAVPHFVAVEDVAQAVPLRAALQRHGNRVVGVAQTAFVLVAGDGVGAGGQHGVNGIVPAAPKAFLRTVA